MKSFHKVMTVLLAAAVLLVGALGYSGLNGMGYHKLTDKKEKGVVNFWYTNDLMTSYYNNVASVYNQLNKDVDVVPKLVSAGEYLEQIYKASIEGESYPDMYVITSDAMEKAFLAGLTLPVDNEKRVSERFPQVALEAASYNGTLMGYPLYFDTSILVYNKTMLEEIALDQFQIQAAAEGVENPEAITVPEEDIARLVEIMIPETIDELIEFSNNLEAPDGLETVFKWNINDVFFNFFYLGEYARLSADEINIYNEGTAACMEVFKHVTEYFYMDAETVSTESILEEFAAGKVLFTILDSESALKLENANSEGLVAFEYDYAMLPDPSGELKGRPLSVSNILVINGYTDYPDTANEFAEFLAMENIGTDQMYERTGYIPACLTAKTTTNMEDIFKEEYAVSINMPADISFSNAWMLLENAFNEIWEGAEAQTALENLENLLQKQVLQ